MHAGKPQKQALAIAYAVRRKAQHKAKGGMIHGMQVNPDIEPPRTHSHLEQALENRMMERSDIETQEHNEPATATLYPKDSREGQEEEKATKRLGERMDVGYSHGGIVKAIMAQRQKDDSMDSEMMDHEADEFLTADMEPEMGSEHMPDDQELHEEEDHEEKKKSLLSKIMAELHGGHLGK